MSEKVKARTLSGFQDLLPGEALQKSRLLDNLKKVFESFGYAPIETPHLEYTEVLIGQTQGEIGKQLYRFKDNGDRDVCLRFDLTVPFSRYVVQHKHELGLPFKRYAIGNAFRGERPQYGRYREFTQCDVDIVGINSVTADAEIVQVIASGFSRLGLNNIQIKINNRKVLNALAELVELQDKSSELIRIIDKKTKVSEDQLVEMFREELAANDSQIKEILDFLNRAAENNQETLKLLEEFSDKSESFKEAYQDLKGLFAVFDMLPEVQEKVLIDLSLARGLGYYTGNVFETVLLDLPEVGSVCGGGRYDNLTQSFENDLTPGVGVSFGLSRILAGLEKLGMQQESRPAQIMLILFEQSLASKVYALATEIRAAGINVEVYPDPVKVKKQFQYADKKGFKYVLVMGSEEVEKGEFVLKDLETGEQESFSKIDQITSKLKSN